MNYNKYITSIIKKTMTPIILKFNWYYSFLYIFLIKNTLLYYNFFNFNFNLFFIFYFYYYFFCNNYK